MTADLRAALVRAACEVRQQAYAKYSQFKVGAALHARDGRIFTGCNVENISYGLTNCAERSAVFAAVAAGCRDFDLLALATSGGVSPCGACRQVLAEFCPELPILLFDVDRPDQLVEVKLSQLLPSRFDHFQGDA